MYEVGIKYQTKKIPLYKTKYFKITQDTFSENEYPKQTLVVLELLILFQFKPFLEFNFDLILRFIICNY